MRHLPRLIAFASLVVVLTAASVMASSQSATVTVSMTVPSNITLTNNCTDPAAYEFGVVVPGSTAMTDTGGSVCSFDFQSSNDTAMLRIGQRDGTGTAMGTPGGSSTTQVGQNGNAMLDMEAYDASIAVAVGYGGDLLRTTDGSATFLKQDIGPNLDLRGVGFVPGNADRAFILDETESVWRTTNLTAGTPTWEQIPIAGWPAVPGGNDITVTAQDTVWVAGDDGTIAVSTNADLAAGSVTWTILVPTSLGGSTPDLEAIDASSTSHIIAAGDSGWVCRNSTGSTGAGDWACTDLGSPFWLEVDVDDTNNAIVGGHRGGISWWDGATWNDRRSNAAFAGEANAVAIDPSNPATAWIGGVRGTVLTTTDAGLTWSETTHGDGAEIERISAPTSTTLLTMSTVGRNIERSTDAGVTWTNMEQQVDAETYLGVVSVDSAGQTAVAVDGDGGIDRTTDGGASWAPVASPTSDALFDITFATANRGWTVGHGGVVLTSTDQGASWTQMSPGTTRRLYDVAADGETHAWVSAADGRVYRTTNGGSSFTELVTTTSNSLVSITRSPVSGTLVAMAGDSTVVRSDDDGDSWTTISGGDIPNSLRPLVEVVATPQGTMYTTSYADSRETWKSTDDGLTWQELPSTILPSGMTTIDSPEDGVLWTGDTGADVWYTDDDTVPATETALSNNGARSIHAVDNNTAFVVGEGHVIRRLDAQAGATQTITDYANGVADWDTAGTTNMFGVCLQAIGGSTTNDPGWTIDGDGTCAATDGPEWAAVPAGVSRLAYTAAAGATGQVDLVWGVRPRDDQAAGNYYATVVFEAVAPNA